MSVLYHCSCSEPFAATRVPPSDLPLATFEHHPLANLLFCEECDAIRCDSCALSEMGCYYCPSCMFEVPSASVRSEKNRCARNCFQCPQCDNTLAVVMSEASSSRHQGGPYYLSCSACQWSSREVGISFEKPTGLSLQLQSAEEGAADLREFDKLRDHLEPYVRRGQALASAGQPQKSAITSSLLKEVPGLASRYSSLLSSSTRLNRNADLRARDELAPFKSTALLDDDTVTTEADCLKAMRTMTDLYEVPSIRQRWSASWNAPLETASLRPQRTPLQAKRSKRCPVCKHILIKPEPKASSTRYKIKLIASNYLPAIVIDRRAPQSVSSRLSTAVPPSSSAMTSTSSSTGIKYSHPDDPLRPGRTYAYELTFSNPLYEPIRVRLAVARPPARDGKPPFAVHLPTASFGISAFAEEWEYEDDEDDELDGASNSSGVVRRKMNTTTVLMDVAISKEASRGPLMANMLVTYVYTDEMMDVGDSKGQEDGTSKKGKKEEKTFSFWTLVSLGSVQPREAASTATPARK